MDNADYGYDIVANTLKDIDQHRKGCFNAMQAKDMDSRINHIKAWYSLIMAKMDSASLDKFKTFNNNINQILNTQGKPWYNESIAGSTLDEYQQILNVETERIFKMTKNQLSGDDPKDIYG